MTLTIDSPVDLVPDIVDDGTRREFVVGGLSLGALLLAGCGDSDDDPRQTSAEGGFPVTLTHKYGRTTIRRKPERVVSLGITEQDIILGLGVTPIAIREYYGNQPYNVWPWAQDKLGSATPAEISSSPDLNFEQIVSLQPDLILCVSEAFSESVYERLSKIAPTVAHSGDHDDYRTPWQRMTRTVGLALGRAAQATRLIADVEMQLKEAGAQHPEFEDKTYIVVFPSGSRSGSVSVSVYGEEVEWDRFLTQLGFKLAPSVVGFLDGEIRGEVSFERVDLLECDALLLGPDDPKAGAKQYERLRQSKLYQRLDVVRNGGEILMPFDLGGAVAFSTVLSIPYALKRLLRVLAAAADGDPATQAEFAA